MNLTFIDYFNGPLLRVQGSVIFRNFMDQSSNSITEHFSRKKESNTLVGQICANFLFELPMSSFMGRIEIVHGRVEGHLIIAT